MSSILLKELEYQVLETDYAELVAIIWNLKDVPKFINL